MAKIVDYQTECILYLKLKAAGKKISQAAFCEKRSKELGCTVSLAYFKKKMSNDISRQCGRDPKRYPAAGSKTKGRRHDYEGLRLEFLAGSWRTIASFCRDKGISEKSTAFRVKTKGWLKEKRAIQLQADEAAVQTLTKLGVGKRIRNVVATVCALEWSLLDIAQKLIESQPNWKPIESTSAAHDGALFVKDLHAALKDITPFLQGLDRYEEMNKVFDRLKTGEIDVAQAIMKLLQMGVEVPKSLQIMLARGIADEPPPDDGEIISTEKILERRQQMLREIEIQRTEFVSVRTREVAEMKAGMAGRDSFAEQN